MTKSEEEWLRLTEPTLIEVDDDGNWYIIWAVTEDKEKTNPIYYESVGFYVHTKATSGSGNKSNNTDKNKLKTNYNKYN